ncbi:putative N(G),N(G)-dimethylarginine dimethylaminohydrolase 1 [Hypsibius exemplaris]|uniref:N(G),N(G)-dimethylarginine dimethylaminohydrolase 1 n=1 Tax=Hypsibius exemplaris TaxID=2072580 RepID=A0A1W0WDC2_HYPEX|nr:putative N(G),N(G)-dimethylarginine dimethylaminohydrolase 1 [Hypsibius exemplaris]
MQTYTDAIVCGIPETIPRSASTGASIDIGKAREQHRVYVETLRKLGMDVWELEPDDNHPDCTFVEDIAIICGDTALLCRPGQQNRENEVKVVKSILFREFSHIELLDLKDDRAKLDGGDVVFTGREIFVGMNKRTNEAGAQQVAKAFPDYPCLAIPLESPLHLKDYISMAGPKSIVVGDSAIARKVLQKIENEATYRYEIISVPDDLANCLYANGTLIHKAGHPNAAKTLADKLRCPKITLDFSELAKLDGHMTSCCLLVGKSHFRRPAPSHSNGHDILPVHAR